MKIQNFTRLLWTSSTQIPAPIKGIDKVVPSLAMTQTGGGEVQLLLFLATEVDVVDSSN